MSYCKKKGIWPTVCDCLACEYCLPPSERISGLEKPNMFVYGGGDDVAEWCKAHDVVHVKEFINKNR